MTRRWRSMGRVLVAVCAGLVSGLRADSGTSVPATLAIGPVVRQADQTTAVQLQLNGTVGGSYRVEATDTLGSPNWVLLAELNLSQSPGVVQDVAPAGADQRLYRAVGTGGPTATARAVAAANAFLATLTDAQRGAVLFSFTNTTQRRRWSNFPTGIFSRAGLKLGTLTAAQRSAALGVVQALLSEQGFRKVTNIVEGDEVLRSQGSSGNLVFGRDEFFISLVGSPSLTAPWMLQFGGHHLAINATVVGTNGVLTPSLTAAQPATYTLNGQTVRPLGNEYDKAFVLMNSLDSSQRTRAIIGSQFRDLVLGPGQDGVTIAPEGIRANALTAAQQEKLLDLASEWVGIVHGDAAAAKMAELRSNISDTYFAWSGPTTAGSAVYFRIQGPTVVIEFAPQSLGGNALNHIHTIYRDPTNDYGVKFWPQ
jgi:Protein of unknown function (DUF3500)